ncbi:Resolvase domain protein [Desulfofarcimen acetoxidans DSM 771]|uniref:Resolvase domain protein n=1 Tax=Desulfofarcimen acetoxidans (strain ATCC 49208 / DSM 771 / KCTC 5769 / VKM B-1644 / 5575) TaxID=485916 RepID=C8W2Y7_DESAS|nr:recombinase family protein [Desulfofarcimen acetoxidans]ACV61143.1 Resolvase domain protein [Desulfofarcimen acetoxidans DSM 771]
MSKHIALYARLSVNENGERDESLETQCDLLKSYVQENIPGTFQYYIDNDISGTYFDRPGLIQMVDNINNNLVDTVLVKDLSRLGRNNGETLSFLDFLKERNIRLIALTDNYDSFRDDDEIIGIKTWVNEHYARDISKKVRYNLKKKMQNGEYLGRPPFGYLKSSLEKNKLVVNEQYRELIPKIFELYIEGLGYRALAEYVQKLGIPTPGQDKNYANITGKSRWSEQNIRRIISNLVYCGISVQGVSEKISFKSRKTRRLDSSRWVVVPDAHEPLVSREIFDLANQIRKKRHLSGEGRKKTKTTCLHLFSGFLICGGCGSPHIFRKKTNRPSGYICGLYNRYGRTACTSHHIREEDLRGLILQDILRVSKGVDFHHKLKEEYRKDFSVKGSIEELNTLSNRLEKCRRQQKTAYLDRLRGIISEDLFLSANSLLDKEKDLLAGKIERLKTLSMQNEESASAYELIIESLKSDNLTKNDIDRSFLERFVKKIIVFERDEKVNRNVRDKYGLDRFWSEDELKTLTRSFKNTLIIYELSLAD